MAHIEMCERNAHLLLSCSTCNKKFHEPKILDCLHSFCYKCLYDQKKNKDFIACNLCGYTTSLQARDINDLPTNSFLKNTIDIQDNIYSIRTHKCAFCSQFRNVQEPADSICLDCKDWLCGTCSERHCLTRITFEHEVLKLDEIKKEKYNNPKLRACYEPQCLRHNDKTDFYCSNCQTDICIQCKVFEHMEHEVTVKKDAEVEVKEILANIVEKYTNLSNNFQHYAVNVREKFQEIQNVEMKCIDYVYEMRDAILCEVKKQALLAEREIVEALKSPKARLENLVKSIEKKNLILEKQKIFSVSLQQNGIPSEMIHLKGVLLKALNFNFSESENITNPPHVTVKVKENNTENLFEVLVNDIPEYELASDIVENEYPSAGLCLENEESLFSDNHKEIKETKMKETLSTKSQGTPDVQTGPTDKINTQCKTDDKVTERKAYVSEFQYTKIPICWYYTIGLRTEHDKCTPRVYDICWLTDTEFVVPDNGNMTLKCFHKDGHLLWFKNLKYSNFFRISCIEGVIATDCSKGVCLNTQNDNLPHINMDNRKQPFPISKGISQETVKVNTGCSGEVRCYSNKGRRLEWILLDRKADINYIAQNKDGELLTTEMNSSLLVKYSKAGKSKRITENVRREWKPMGIITDSCDDIYVADGKGNCIVKFSSNGNMIGVLDISINEPLGLSMSTNNQLLVNTNDGIAYVINIKGQ